MNVCADACSDETMTLGSRGEFGTNYLFNESCKWSIQVNPEQVIISGILYFSFSQKSNAQDNERQILITLTDCVTVGFLASNEWEKKCFVLT